MSQRRAELERRASEFRRYASRQEEGFRIEREALDREERVRELFHQPLESLFAAVDQLGSTLTEQASGDGSGASSMDVTGSGSNGANNDTSNGISGGTEESVTSPSNENENRGEGGEGGDGGDSPSPADLERLNRILDGKSDKDPGA